MGRRVEQGRCGPLQHFSQLPLQAMQQRRCLSNVNCAYIQGVRHGSAHGSAAIRHPPSPAVSTNSFADRTTIVGVLRLCNKLDATRLMKTTHKHHSTRSPRCCAAATKQYTHAQRTTATVPLRASIQGALLEGRLWLSSGHRTEAFMYTFRQVHLMTHTDCCESRDAHIHTHTSAPAPAHA